MTDLPVLRLRPKSKPQAIRHGFSWVFADEAVLDRRSRGLPPGSFAVLEDAERKPLGLVTVNPNSKIVGRMMDADPQALIDGNWLKTRLARALQMRERLYDAPFYRLVHAESDGLPGLVIDALSPVAMAVIGNRMPVQASDAWLSIVPIEESRSSYNGLLVFIFITAAASLAVYFIHRFASRAIRRGPAWGCGFTDPAPAAQYSGVSFVQPIRRVFGTLIFQAREHVDMPPPGDLRPARLRIDMHDPVWERLYTPVTETVWFFADRLNQLQFLTIRRYLSLVFATLVTLLLALAIWS